MIRRFLIVVTFFLLISGGVITSVSAEETPWLRVDKMSSYADKNLAANSNLYPVSIKCRVRNNWIEVKLQLRSKDGGVPYNKWQFVVSNDPESDLKKINPAYQSVSISDVPGPQSCGLGYR